MIGIIYLLAFGLYLLISLGIVRWVMWHARNNNKSAKRWGWSAALVMYLVPFWDWLPTVAAHQYYCAKDSDFWVYKTLDQWKAENPGVMEGLASYNKNPSGFAIHWPSRYELHSDGHWEITTYQMNERFNRIIDQQDMLKVLPIVRREETLIDVGKNEVIARYVDFSSGVSVKAQNDPSGPIKFWLRSSGCSAGSDWKDKSWEFSFQFNGVNK